MRAVNRDNYMLIETTAGLMGVSCIYAIVHRDTGRVYIGSTCCIKTRLGSHRSDLRANKHDNSYLQNAWNVYGECAFDVLLLEACSREILQSRESFWMEQTSCCDRSIGFNLDLIAVRKFHSEETKKKISLGNIGKVISDEVKRRISECHKGRKHPPRTLEQRANHAAARTGKKHSPETIKKLCISQQARFNRGQMFLW